MPDLEISLFNERLRGLTEARLRRNLENREIHDKSIARQAQDLAGLLLEKTPESVEVLNMQYINDSIVADDKQKSSGVIKYRQIKMTEGWVIRPDGAAVSAAGRVASAGLILGPDGRLFNFLSKRAYSGIPDGVAHITKQLLVDSFGLSRITGTPWEELPYNVAVVYPENSRVWPAKQAFIDMSLFVAANKIDLSSSRA